MSDWRLSSRATRDLTEIYAYGFEKFGKRAADRYAESLRTCFRRLALNPRLGRMAATIGSEVRRLEHRHHVVFYEIEEGGVLVLAIIHERSIRGLEP